MSNLDKTLKALENEQVIAYPTEGVFGVGCDPDSALALKRLLTLKQRPQEKGLILVAASYKQLATYVDESQLSLQRLEEIKQSWPGAVTWIVPADKKVLSLVTGGRDTVAVRVSDHPLVIELCNRYNKPITSTSANLSGLPACMNAKEVLEQLNCHDVTILDGETGGRNKPSEIRDAQTLKIIRQG
ncbi:L-threonylcarbamoyladenylate synthase [Vibrio sonorensis]|uniref:L-threonylcarbamoyladenylate synthase n=1 Tax=Vibrio sonorensis TaxID=1004316 RepID=UPI0008DA041C|nr:L-threonylcarbamoyladenylate synthase [Vibrio sonorensis]